MTSNQNTDLPPVTLPPGYWRWVVVNSSGGKDSQTALHHVVLACHAAGLPPSRIVVSHQCLGRAEWGGTLELARKQADHYGLPMLVSKYRDKHGAELSLLEQVRRRGKWPDSANRYCTSDNKRGPGGRVLTRLSKTAPGAILNVLGFRAEESPSRAKRATLTKNARFSSAARQVWDWLPIHNWTTEQVWRSIRSSGVPYHPAYDRGMTRLSCVFCIFAPRQALLRAGKENLELLDEYCELEAAIGHDFKHNQPLREIRDAIHRGEVPTDDDGAWNM